MQTRHVIGNRNVNTANVERIVSRNNLQHSRRIANRLGQRTNMIQRPRKRNHASRRNAPISRLDPHAPAQRSGLADRSSRISTNRRITKPCSHSSSRSSRRSSSNVLRIPGIVNISEKADQRTAAISKLVQIVLAQNDRSRLPQSQRYLSILSGHAILVKPTGGRCPRAAVSIKSFKATGIPCKGPRHSPREISISAARASASADSAVTVIKAFSPGLSFSIRSRQARVSSTGETSFRLSRGASSTIVSKASICANR